MSDDVTIRRQATMERAWKDVLPDEILKKIIAKGEEKKLTYPFTLVAVAERRAPNQTVHVCAVQYDRAPHGPQSREGVSETMLCGTKDEQLIRPPVLIFLSGTWGPIALRGSIDKPAADWNLEWFD
jgi:hypothetical protein